MRSFVRARKSLAKYLFPLLILAAAGTGARAGEAGPPTAELEAAAQRYFPNEVSQFPQARIIRLTRDQIDLTVATLFPGYDIPSVKTAVPRDPLQTNYEFAEMLTLQPANLGALETWISAISEKVRRNPSGVIKCADPGSADQCLDAAARDFVVRAYRGDVTEQRLSAVVAFYLDGVKKVGFNQATSDLVTVVLNSPSFLFRNETETGRGNRLAPAPLLEAVTYTISDAPPERLDLSSSRAEQYLRSGPVAAATIGNILGTPAARAKLTRFVKSWLEIKDPKEFTISAEIFPEFTANMAAAMVADLDRVLTAELSKPSPSLKSLTQAMDRKGSGGAAMPPRAMAATPIAATLVATEPDQRFGIFTHPAVIASHSGPTNSRPIKRGVFWARKVICLDLAAPPKDLHAKFLDLEGVTERQRIERSTRRAACAGCHKGINPLGFFLEPFDALGRPRSVDNGNPIDASILIDFLDGPPVKTETTADALHVLTNSTKFNQCFVRQMFRFYMNRFEEPTDDPVLRRMFLTFSEGNEQDILKTLFTLVSSDRIVRRQ